ncbi:MAG: FG-GAP repeat domain-containing protein [Gammaproteobacteria bacterium]
MLDFNADGRQDMYAPIAGKWYVLRARPFGGGLDDFPTILGADGYNNSPRVGDFDSDGLVDVALDYGPYGTFCFIGLAIRATLPPSMPVVSDSTIALRLTTSRLPIARFIISAPTNDLIPTSPMRAASKLRCMSSRAAAGTMVS